MMKKQTIGNQIDIWQNLPDSYTNEENLKLLKEYKKTGDISLRDKLIYGNMKFVIYLMRKNAPGVFSTRVTSKYTHEDLAQDAVLTMINAVENFDPDLNNKFCTYLGECIRCKFIDFFESNIQDTLSLNAIVNSPSDHSSKEFEEFFASENGDFDSVNDKLEIDYIKKKILPILSRQEKRVFENYYINGLNMLEISKLEGVSRQHIDSMIKEVSIKVRRLVKNGVTEADLLLRKVSYTNSQKERVDTNFKLIKKYGSEFLKTGFMPMLTEKQAQIFDRAVFHYYGQTYGFIEEINGVNSISTVLKSVLKKMQKLSPRLDLLSKNFKPKATKSASKKVTKYKESIEKLVENYGGRLFLYTYFLPALPEKEKQVFACGVLEYVNEKHSYLAQKCGLSLGVYKDLLTKTLNKLKSYDLDIIVDVKDRSAALNFSLGSFNQYKIAKIKARMNVVKKHGGIMNLCAYFLPTLSESYARIFNDMYLYPKFDSLTTMANYYGVDLSTLTIEEKCLVEKLNNFDLKAFKQIRRRAEIAYRNQVSQNYKEVKNFDKLLEKYGGKEFLLQVYSKRLSGINKEVFIKCFIEHQPIENVLSSLGLPSTEKDKILSIHHNCYAGLRRYIEANADYSEKVRQFYIENNLPVPAPFDMDNQIDITKKYSLSQIGDIESLETRKNYMSKILSICRDKREIVREFIPTLKKLSYQQVFVSAFLEYNLDKDTASEFGLEVENVKRIKQEVYNLAVNFVENKNQKSKNK